MQGLVTGWPVAGEFELLVLLALMRLGNGAFGAAIHREIATRTGRDLPASSVYVTLDRLEGKRMVCSYTGTPTHERGGRRRKHYLARHRRSARHCASVALVCIDDRRHSAGPGGTVGAVAAGDGHGESAAAAAVVAGRADVRRADVPRAACRRATSARRTSFPSLPR